MLDTIHNAMVQELKKIKGVNTCEAYPKIKKKIVLPAILIELAEMKDGTDPGTGELSLVTRWEARTIIDSTHIASGFNVRNLVATVALKIFQASTFGLKITPAIIIDVGPDEFTPEIIGYNSWVVSWEHEIHLGESIWDGIGARPTNIYLGIDPKIGKKHEKDYKKITKDRGFDEFWTERN